MMVRRAFLGLILLVLVGGFASADPDEDYELGKRICNYIECGNPAALREALNELDVESRQFSRIFRATLCDGNRNLLRMAVDMSGMYNNLDFVRYVAGQLYREGPDVLRERLLDLSEYDPLADDHVTKISIMEYVRREAAEEESRNPDFRHWRNVREFLETVLAMTEETADDS